ncbi:carbohydrate-binding module family 66 protein [Periconia macrospinosa]|uniref:Carbohydrate-binding module family 66 protein n=1 Tax=Periconia macrospinosa TaxID=97972 RepID=A0A2V1DTK6_9PLEO|nr:carbohydrate-binding module family 66 protein [Periconia macrospinosa]
MPPITHVHEHLEQESRPLKRFVPPSLLTWHDNLKSIVVSNSPICSKICPEEGLNALNYTTAEAGNPFIEGWYADPDTAIYNDLYWIFPTSSLPYEQQTYLDAFSSPDLINWTKHPNILTVENVKWANKAVWAPAPAFVNGKYYLYFGANDIQEGEPEQGIIGGIGVAVADQPQGPYVDAIGKPLIGEYFNDAQPIDQDVFIDDDGQAYIYYGGHDHANVAKLNSDMISFGKFDDNTTFKEITPDKYVEGSQMIKKDGKYYFMWSEGGWTGPDYAVAYAIADSPLGPFETRGRILQQDNEIAKGSGHNGVIHIPGTDIYYITYHRRPLTETNQNHRVVCYDRMYFNSDGTIAPVNMLVKDNFADGDFVEWKTDGGVWGVVDQRLEVKSGSAAFAVQDTNFTNLVFDATVSVPGIANDTVSAGLVFRVNRASAGVAGFSGYYAGLSPSGILTLEAFESGNRTNHTSVAATFNTGVNIAVRVKAIGDSISIFLDDLETPKLSVSGASVINGTTGVATFGTDARFGSVSVAKASGT